MEKTILILLFATIVAFSADYKTLHRHAVVADAHNDMLMRAMQGDDLSIRSAKGHSDIVRLKEGGVDLQIFSVWCGPEYGKGRAFNRALAMIDTLNAIVRRASENIVLTGTYNDVRSTVYQGKIAALIGVEGGHMIEDRISNLDSLAARGMNYLTLTWNNSTSWATSAADETERGDSLAFKGLTDFGRKVVSRMNELGVMVDLSHTGEKTFWDALAVTKRPVIVSHSSVYAICPSRRNLKDDQIKAIANNKGVICVNFYSEFIDRNYSSRIRAVKERHSRLGDSILQTSSNKWEAERVIESALYHEYQDARPSLSQLVDHIDYIVKMVGADFVGIGSDFDGVESLPKEMDDVTFLPNITRELLKRGYAEKEIKKILGGNVLRVLQANMNAR
ncbi:MAG: dipeptidase [Bacteroidota bacterium]